MALLEIALIAWRSTRTTEAPANAWLRMLGSGGVRRCGTPRRTSRYAFQNHHVGPDYITAKNRLAEVVEAAVERAVRKVLAEQTRTGGPDRRWLTSREAQAYLGLHRTTLARYRATGRLPYSKVQSSVYYRLADIEALLERGMQGAE